MASAILVFVCALVGLGGGPLFVGAISDLAKSSLGESSLLAGYAGLIPAILLAIILHLMAANAIGRREVKAEA